MSMLLGKPLTEEINILLLGLDSLAREKIANCLVNMKDQFENKTVRVSRSLPLPDDSERPRIDFIVLLLDMTNRKSFTAVLCMLKQISIEYFLGRSMLIIINSEIPGKYAISSDEIRRIANAYRLNSQFCTIQDEASIFETCLAISKRCFSSLRQKDLNCMFSTCLEDERLDDRFTEDSNLPKREV